MTEEACTGITPVESSADKGQPLFKGSVPSPTKSSDDKEPSWNIPDLDVVAMSGVRARSSLYSTAQLLLKSSSLFL